MNAERCLLAGEALGLGYAALAKAARYARDRVVFGRPIGMNQGVQHPLAAAYMGLEAAKLATYHAARLYDESATAAAGKREGGEGGGTTQHALGVACNSAKYLAAEAAFVACERAVSFEEHPLFLLCGMRSITRLMTVVEQVLAHGGMGYAQEYHVERYLRECFVPRIAPVSRVSFSSRH